MDTPEGLNTKRLAQFLRTGFGKHYMKRYRSPGKQLSHQMETWILHRLLKRVGRSHDILDAPCGPGRFFPVLSQYADAVHLADISPDMLATARERTQNQAASYNIVNLVNLDANAVYEGVVSLRLIHHLHDKQAQEMYLQNLAHIASRWIIVTFCDSSSFRVIFRQLKRRLLHRPEMRTKSLSDIRKAMEANGFHLVKSHLLRPFSGHRYALFERGAQIT